MDLKKELANVRALLAKSPVEQWEAMALHTTGLELSVRGNSIDKFSQSDSLGLSIRVVKDGKLGFSYLMGGTENELSLAVEQAINSAKGSDFEFTGSLPQPEEDMAQCDIYDPAIETQTLEDRKQRAITLANAAKDYDPKVVHVYPAGVEEYSSNLHLINSHGLDVSYKSSSFSAGAEAMADANGEQEVGWEGRATRFLADLDPYKIGTEAGKKAVANLGGKPIGDGLYDVILENRVTAQFLGILAASFTGDNVLKGRSLMADKLNTKALSDKITIIDDGLYPKELGTAPFDDEGTPQGKTYLVDQGVVKGFVYDCVWGAMQGCESTGNASRGSLKAPPSVSFTNLYLEPGIQELSQMIKGLKKGLYITEILGGHTADPVTGEFSFGASGMLIENGVFTQPVKSVAIAGTIPQVFSAVVEVASDLRFFGQTGAPSVLVTEMSVSGP